MKDAVVYPAGTSEIPEDLTTNELVRRLKVLTKALRDSEQEAETRLGPLAAHLAREAFVGHASREVRVLVAVCLADIFRLFVPESPFAAPADLERVLLFLIRQLRGLDNERDAHWHHFHYLLENLTVVKSLTLALDLADSQPIVVQLLRHVFAVLRCEHETPIQNFALDLITPVLQEAEPVSNEAIDILFANLVEPVKTQSPDAYNTAKALMSRCESALEPHVQLFFNQALLSGQVKDCDVVSGGKLYSVIGALYEISPSLLNSVLPQLEYKLQSETEKERTDVVRLLSRLFADTSTDLADDYPQLWQGYLGRFNDKRAEIRAWCVTKSVELMLRKPVLRAAVSDALCHRSRDLDESVRLAFVSAVTAVAKKQFGCIDDNLMTCLTDRARDKKFKVRREALLCLGTLYRKSLVNDDMTPAEIESLADVRNRLLFVYYQTSLEDKLLCEKLLHVCLVPYLLATNKRMDVLFDTYCALEENAKRAFDEILKQQGIVRDNFRKYLVAIKEVGLSEVEQKATVEQCLRKLAVSSVDPAQTYEYLTEFHELLRSDNRAVRMLDYIVGEEYTTKKIEDAVKELLNKLLSSQSGHQHLQASVKALLERVAPLMIDADAVECLVVRVAAAIDGAVDDERACERSLRLLLVLSDSFPHAFRTEPTLRRLVAFMTHGNELACETACRVLARVGSDVDKRFPELYRQLLPELATVATGGTARQAKYAVRCLESVAVDAAAQLRDVVPTLIESVGLSQPNLLSALAALGAVAESHSQLFAAELKRVLGNTVVPKIILSAEPHSNCDDVEVAPGAWLTEQQLSAEAKAKIAGIKFVVHLLCGLKSNEADMCTNAIKLLAAAVESHGDIRNDGSIRDAEMAHLRLVAGRAFLKLAEIRAFSSLIKVSQLQTIAALICDDCEVVRERFALKLNKALSTFRLPLEYMAIFALAPFSRPTEAAATKSFISKVRNCVVTNISIRRELLRTRPELQKLPATYMPEYALAYAVHLLAHYPRFVSLDDAFVLSHLKEGFWFMLECYAQRKDFGAQFHFLYQLFQHIKQARDALNPDDDLSNRKMWAMCDLGMLLIVYRVPNFLLKGLPQKSSLSPRYFIAESPSEESSLNTTVYLPVEVLDDEKRRYGKHRPAPASAGAFGTSLSDSRAAASTRTTAKPTAVVKPAARVVAADERPQTSRRASPNKRGRVSDDRVSVKSEGSASSRSPSPSPPPPPKRRGRAAAVAAESKRRRKGSSSSPPPAEASPPAVQRKQKRSSPAKAAQPTAVAAASRTRSVGAPTAASSRPKRSSAPKKAEEASAPSPSRSSPRKKQPPPAAAVAKKQPKRRKA